MELMRAMLKGATYGALAGASFEHLKMDETVCFRGYILVISAVAGAAFQGVKHSFGYLEAIVGGANALLIYAFPDEINSTCNNEAMIEGLAKALLASISINLLKNTYNTNLLKKIASN